MSTIKHIFVLSVCFTSLNTMHNDLTARKVDSPERKDRQYSKRTKLELAKKALPKTKRKQKIIGDISEKKLARLQLQLAKKEKDTKKTARNKDKAKNNRARARARTQKLQLDNASPLEEYVILTSLGTCYGSTLKEAQEQYRKKTTEVVITEAKEEEKKRTTYGSLIYDKWEKDQEAITARNEQEARKAEEDERTIYWSLIYDKWEKDQEAIAARNEQEARKAEEDNRWFDKCRQAEIEEINELTAQFYEEKDEHEAEEREAYHQWLKERAKAKEEEKNKIISSQSRITLVRWFDKPTIHRLSGAA